LKKQEKGKDLNYPGDGIVVVGIRWRWKRGPLTAKIANVEEEEDDESGGDWYRDNKSLVKLLCS
jgi:hypothetical protein